MFPFTVYRGFATAPPPACDLATPTGFYVSSGMCGVQVQGLPDRAKPLHNGNAPIK
ncbi:hypothetical protein [Prevotella koreensis]